MRRHTSNPSTPPVVTTSNGDEYEREGWIETNRKRIENTAEGLAVALITMVAIGNAWVFMG
ncbi:hypothetical protein FRC12_017758 [Ceratobasidium sp. 428]|nr:hypothetical protein FRC12_017758 [Ceratobasidium sp. 428]